MLVINPFYMLLFFYLAINFIFACIGFSNNQVEIEFNNFSIESSVFMYAFLIQLFVCLLILSTYLVFEKKTSKSGNFLILKRGSILLLLLQVFFLIYNFIYGINIAGVDKGSNNQVLNLIFILIPADILFFLVSPYIKSNKWFYLNFFVFVISNTLRGWMGGIYLAIFVAICRQETIKLSFKFLIWFSLSFIILLLLLPYLSQIKWAIRSDQTIFEAIEAVNDNNYFLQLEESIYYVFGRFQHNYHVALLMENYSVLSMEYNKGSIMPFWMEGIVQNIVLSIFNVNLPPSLGNQMAEKLFYSEETWSSNPGLSGWFIVLREKFIFLVIYSIFILSLSFYTAAKYFDKKMALILGVFSIIYLFHGWIGSYVTLVTYLLVIMLIRRVKL